MPTSREPIHRWPSWIEPALVDGYSVESDDRRVTSDFELSSEFRVEFDTDRSTAVCTLALDALQSNWFETFERDILKQGSRWFLLDLWVGGKMIEHRARFKSRPEATYREGEEWIQYSFELELLKREGLLKLTSNPSIPVPSWPTEMPVPITDGYSIKPQDRRVTSEYEIGTSFRIQFSTDEATAACTLSLKPDEANWFEAFERDTLKQGSRWFTMPLWVAGQMHEHKVRFATRPKLTKELGEYSLYAFELDIAQREGLMDQGMAELLLDIDPYEMMKIEDKLQIIVNVRFPKSLPFIEA